MKGSNEMKLNLASLQVMVQHYFDDVLFQPGQVEVAGLSLNTASADNTVTVKLKEAEPTKAPLKMAS